MVNTLAGMNEEEILQIAAGLERGSEHPLAAAVVQGNHSGTIHRLLSGQEKDVALKESSHDGL